MGRPLRFAAPPLVLVLALGACAKVGPPPGGPEDRESPQVAEIVPGAEAAGVAPDSAVTLVFSEKPDQRSVLRSLRLLPRTDFREARWENERLRLVPEPAWPAERNVLLWIGPEAKDRRGNLIAEPFLTRFTTRAVLDSGRVAGTVWAGNERTTDTVLLVGAYPVTGEEAFDPETSVPVALARPDEQGRYTLDGLDTEGAVRVVGLIERDFDLVPTARREAWAEPADMVPFRPTAPEPLAVPDFLVGTLDSAGTIAGTVQTDSGQVAVLTAVAASAADGAEPAAREVLAGGGTFSLSLATGRAYRLAVFLDLDADTLRAEAEPEVALEEPVSLEFRNERKGVEFDLTGLASPPGAEDQEGGEEAPPGESAADGASGGDGGDTEGGGE